MQNTVPQSFTCVGTVGTWPTSGALGRRQLGRRSVSERRPRYHQHIARISAAHDASDVSALQQHWALLEEYTRLNVRHQHTHLVDSAAKRDLLRAAVLVRLCFICRRRSSQGILILASPSIVQMPVVIGAAVMARRDHLRVRCSTCTLELHWLVITRLHLVCAASDLEASGSCVTSLHMFMSRLRPALHGPRRHGTPWLSRRRC